MVAPRLCREMIVDTRDAVFGGEQLFPSRGMWFEDITNNQPAYFVPRRGDASRREREEIPPPPAVRQRLTSPDSSQQQQSRRGNTAIRNAQQESHVPQSPMVVDRKRLTELYFTCPLCQKILTEPYVLTGCMHRFCRVCIESWFGLEKAKMCPTCGVEYTRGSDLSRYLRRDQMYESMIQEIFAQCQEEAISSQNVNRVVDNGPKIEKRVMTSSLSQGMSRYTENALRNRVRGPMISLRDPTVIISLSFDHQTQNDWRYVSCPLDKSIWQLKQVVAKHIHGSTSPDSDSLGQSLRFHLMLDVRSFPEKRRQDISNALCSNHHEGIDDCLSFRDILEVTGQPARRPNSHEYASSSWGSIDVAAHLDASPVDGMTTHGQRRDMPSDLGGPGGRDISNRWPLFLQHVSTCTSAPGMCSHGETCDMMKSLGLHIRDCHVDQCTYPRCQPWKGLVASHGAGCNNTSCLVCTLQKVGSRSRDQPSTTPASHGQHPGRGTATVFRELGGTLRFHVSQAS